MKIAGLMCARDEENTVALTLESVAGLIDFLVLVDHASKDRTRDVVRHSCDLLGIDLYEDKANADKSLWECRRMARERAEDIGCDWTFTVDADMWFIYTDMIRNLAKAGKYDAYWFRTVNFSMDLWHIAGLNPPHVWLIRNKPGIKYGANYMVPQQHFTSDPNKDRFIGFNATYLKSIDHIFWRRHIPGQRTYNKKNNKNISVDEYIKMVYDEEPGMEYKKQFVLGIFQEPDDWELDEAKYGKRTWALSRPAPYDEKEYGPIPERLLNSKLSNYKMVFDKEGKCVGRIPDLIMER